VCVGGVRPWAANLGHRTIPALVDANVQGAVLLKLALIENVVREDLTPIEAARTTTVLRTARDRDTKLGEHLLGEQDDAESC
jgi:ParB-like chromosome segregation protein Spo0J